MNWFKLPLIAGIIAAGTAFSSAGEYESHGLKRLVDRLIYIENNEYQGSIPKMQSVSKSGFKVASLCKVGSSSINAIYGKDLNESAIYYSTLFSEVYVMALQPSIPVDGAAAHLYKNGHSLKTSNWAAQRMSLVRSTMTLLHGDLGFVGPAGMPAFTPNLANQNLTAAEFSTFMIGVKAKAESSKSLTTQMAAALASTPSQLNTLVDKSSFIIKDKIAGLLADPTNADSVPMQMRTNDKLFNPQNVGDLYLALGVMALHIQNPSAISDAGIKPPQTVLTALNNARDHFIVNDTQSRSALAKVKQGKPIWNNAPLGPAKL